MLVRGVAYGYACMNVGYLLTLLAAMSMTGRRPGPPVRGAAPYDVVVTDTSPGALPGLAVPAAAAFVEAVGGVVNPKFGWTDVARFSALGVPAVNFGPGDPMFAHKQDEHVPTEHIERCERILKEWLS